MNKELFKILELSESATTEQVSEKIVAIVNENKQLTTDKNDLEIKLNKIEEAAVEQKLRAFQEDLQLAAKDGRINFDANGTTEQRWLSMFKTDSDNAMALLSELPKRTSNLDKFEEATEQDVKLSAMEKRRLEIQEQNKK